jgi:hypothetical protein
MTSGLLVANLACQGVVGPGATPTGNPTMGGGGNTGSAGTGSPGQGGNPGQAGSNPVGIGGNTGIAGDTGQGGTGGSGPICVGNCECVRGIPATSQVPRMTRLQYDQVVRDLLNVTGVASNMNQPPSTLLAEDSAAALTQIGWDAYLSTAEKIATEVIAGANRSRFTTCAATATGAALTTCLTADIRSFGRKLFRRPLTDEEVTSFLRFQNLTPAGTTNEIIESVLFAMLASPSFIMLPELAQTQEMSPSGNGIKLTSHEVATRLSFLLWNSVGDDILSTAADMNQLQTGEAIRTQALRMLQSPKAAGGAATFHRYYADIAVSTHWLNRTTHSIGNFTMATYNAAMAELDAFFGDLVVSGGTFRDLFNSPNGFVTSQTAPIYGVTSTAMTPTKMALDATKRPGFLTRVGFLSTHAHEMDTSPIQRGAFITQRVLGIPVGVPDPRFLMMTPPAANYTTQRQAMEALTNGAPCNTCHTARVNPPGFVLERYNAIGAWQDTDRLTGAINSTAEVLLSVTPETTKTISTPAELMAEIPNQPNAKSQYAQFFVSFATGRSPNNNDTCIVDQLVTGLNGASYTIATMMADYTQADSFRLRTLGN